MPQLDSIARAAAKKTAAPSPGPARRRPAPTAVGAADALDIRSFPAWARLAAAPADHAEAAFLAGASIALLDGMLRAGADGAEPPHAGVLRQRLALESAAACVRLARRREDEAALRDAEHLAGAGPDPGPAARLHRLFRLGATRPLALDADTLGLAAGLLELRTAPTSTLDGLAAALRDIAARAGSPLAAAAGASRAAMVALAEAAPIEAEIVSLWLADLALAQKLGWERPVPLLAAAIARPTLRRGPAGKRPRPGDLDWAQAGARAYALAAREACGLAADLSRRAQKLQALTPKLRAEGAGRVVELLLADDALSPAHAARAARLSDRAARRLFDRLVDLGAVRELTGRPNFRLYGL